MKKEELEKLKASAPNHGVILKLIELGWCGSQYDEEGVADEIWELVSQWIGDAQASEFKVGHDSGYGEGYRKGFERGVEHEQQRRSW